MKSKLIILALMVTTLLGWSPVWAASYDESKSGEFVLKCFGCHGRNGVTGYTGFPNLAGQSETYLFNQLKTFRDGHRQDITMNAMPFMVKDLSDDDLLGLAGIFTSFPDEIVQMNKLTKSEAELFKKGEEIIGGTKTTCRFCHLANSSQDAPTVPEYPVLVGQQKGYLINQIKAFRDGVRWSPIMNADLVGELTDEEVEAIAVYLRYKKAQ
ncbi:MAG: c-type cytochrome [Bdellovibrionaceae bacterium]|nr:c-type cytochrome [Bdellovibrionales bacterium]MCB9085940.1 c-type cytochrome [Pseudobdellovibrionaceae bacterium]